MAPSQLKQLKASIHERRVANGTRTVKANTKELQNGQQASKNKKRQPKSFSEETRRKTLLVELQRRYKVGGIVDRRIGENDPTMTPDERMLQRFIHQRNNRDSVFDLEEADEEEHVTQLTHLGRAVIKDDYDDVDFSVEGIEPPSKRRRLSNEDEGADEDKEGRDYLNRLGSEKDLGRKKSKREIMSEVIAKSKLHKYERQQAKEEDDDVREQLDKDLPDILSMLKNGKAAQAKEELQQAMVAPMLHPDRASQINGGNLSGPKEDANKNYDVQLRQMAQDKRAQPTERTKTEEEKAAEAADRLKELEDDRLRRMEGEEDSSSELEPSLTENDPESINEASAFGLSDVKKNGLVGDGVEDEDDFIIDDDLVASGSNIDTDVSDFSDGPDDNSSLGQNSGRGDDEDDADFLRILEEPKSLSVSTSEPLPANDNAGSSHLAYTYPCPQTHDELLKIVANISKDDLPTVIQRIRALHHPSLDSQNKERLSKFATVLIDHVDYMARHDYSLLIIENVIRHVHSLAKTYADAVSVAFRDHLQRMYDEESMSPGDLLILSAIGTIYPTSDHFHQVVTPAITIMARWLGLHQPKTTLDLSTGSYLVQLCLKYQNFSKRYVPEAVNFTCAIIEQTTNAAAIESQTEVIRQMTKIWGNQVAFLEIFSPGLLGTVASKQHTAGMAKKLRVLLHQAQLSRRPLELHHHRPLPIKSAIPKFEEAFNPDKHYDPDKERSEANKLRHEYKRERKGALRELRKDASFIAREKLKAKKEADRAYETKQRRLIAEIQAEEGREKNAYEREKRARKGRR